MADCVSLVNVFLFRPPRAKPYDIPSDVIYLRTAKGSEIGSTFIERKDANVTILFSHANAEDLNSSYAWMKILSEKLDVNVFGYDYTGYGSSRSTLPSESNCYADIDAAFAYLTEERGINPEQIVLYGRSLGSGPSCYLASRTAASGRPVAALVLHAPFTSVYRIVLDLGFTLLGDQFANIDRISQIQCPVCIIHGEDDKVVPFEHGRALHAALPENYKATPFFVKGMGHNYMGFKLERALMKELNDFLDYHVLARRLWMKS